MRKYLILMFILIFSVYGCNKPEQQAENNNISNVEKSANQKDDNNTAKADDTIDKSNNAKSGYTPKTYDELKALVENNDINLGAIDTSKITDMTALFKDSKREDFSGISSWDTSNVKSMASMFSYVKNFNEDIGSWDTSNVENMECMFWNASSFNQDISKWNTSKVKNMRYMFYYAERFNQNISSWDVSNVENMQNMFTQAIYFNQDLSAWNTAKALNKLYMFDAAGSLTDLPQWYLDFDEKTFLRSQKVALNKDNKFQPKNKEELLYLLEDITLDLGTIDTSKIEDMSYLFKESERDNFSGIESWDTSNVYTMAGMFQSSYFNQDISSWDVSNVYSFEKMFDNAASFDQNLDKWNVTLNAKSTLRGMFMDSPMQHKLPKWYKSIVDQQ